MTYIQLSFVDRLLAQVQTGLLAAPRMPSQPSPADAFCECVMDAQTKKHTAALMRINHCGEVCAQALYQGQALVARSQANYQHLLEAAQEEHDHLLWCKQRLDELDAKPSILAGIFYTQSFMLGVCIATVSDEISLGFIAETEKQVANHLALHINQLDPQDQKTHALLIYMREDEMRHGAHALKRGGTDFPIWAQYTMTLLAHCMKKITYRL